MAELGVEIMTQRAREIERLLSKTFAEITSFLGYSEIHGRIIAALIMARGPLSLNELSKATGYSASSISLSLDLLEMLGIVKKFKKIGDRKLYVELSGDLLEGLRKALFLKAKRSIENALEKFDELEKQAEGEEKIKKAIELLKKEMKRIERYIDELYKVKLPK